MPPRAIRILFEVEAELRRLPDREVKALHNAIEKLSVLGEELPYPHSSAVKVATSSLRELRPRSGDSRWRALYRRVGDEMVIAAIGPDAQADARGFGRAVRLATERLAAWEARH